jgi:S1-C subfamily serine protease
MRGTAVLRRTLGLGCVGCFETLFYLFISGSISAEAACIDPSAYVHAVASITRHFSDEEKSSDASLLGARGTAWFLSSATIVTAAHVTRAMHLSGETWKQIEIEQAGRAQYIEVRIQRLAGSHTEKIAVLELRTDFAGAQVFEIRKAPLIAGQRVVSLAYPSSVLRFAQGRFIRYEDEGALSGAALLEMYDGDDRLVLDHGASGAPVLDCDGRVAAVVSNIFTTAMSFMAQAIRISTAWGSPNVASAPISELLSPSTAD